MMAERITSTSNPKIKRIRKLADRKERASEGVYLAEGLRIVIEAIQTGQPLETLVIAPELMKSNPGDALVREYLAAHPEHVIEVSADVFRSFSVKDGPQGVAALLQPVWKPLESTQPGDADFYVALDEVADPGNLGTILRTADAAGARGVFLIDQCTDPYDPAALRAGMGAHFALQLVRASFAEFKAWKEQTSIHLVGTSDRAKANYREVVYPSPVVVLMGSEREGLEERHFELCDQVVSIPMGGRGDSLNLAVATGIMLYEIRHQVRA
jgi:RNA methyltransferase, TrmH family